MTDDDSSQKARIEPFFVPTPCSEFWQEVCLDTGAQGCQATGVCMRWARGERHYTPPPGETPRSRR